MMPVFRLRKWHRWLGVVIGVQLSLWIVSGIYFAWSDIDMIHGDELRVFPEPVVADSTWVSPTEVTGVAGTVLTQVAVVDLLGRPTWRIDVMRDGERATVLADATTGSVRPPLSQEEARSVAVASFASDAAVTAVDSLCPDDVDAHHEYRGGPLPAWRVSFAHGSGTRVYVSAAGGHVVTHRNARWRIFDFLWMLHTMDYRGRDDINTAQLRIVSVAALLVGVSGYGLFWRTRKRRR